VSAWNELLTNSIAPLGSDAWTHLMSQEGGGGGTVVLDGERFMTVGEQSLQLLANDEGLIAAIGDAILAVVEPGGATMAIEIDDGEITLGD